MPRSQQTPPRPSMAIAASTRSTPHRQALAGDIQPIRVGALAPAGPTVGPGAYVRTIRATPRALALQPHYEPENLLPPQPRRTGRARDGPRQVRWTGHDHRDRLQYGRQAVLDPVDHQAAPSELDVKMVAIDILPDVVEIAREGWWDGNTDHIERLTPDEIDGIFDRIDGRLRVKAWLRDAVRFVVGDGYRGGELIERLGRTAGRRGGESVPHAHAERPDAAAGAAPTSCELVRRRGTYSVCTGVDIDVRTTVLARTRLGARARPGRAGALGR